MRSEQISTVLAFCGRTSALKQALRQARKVAMATGTDRLGDPIVGPKICQAFRAAQIQELYRQIGTRVTHGGNIA